MSDSVRMSPEERERWFIVDFLSLPAESTGDDIKRQMRLVYDAQDRINYAAHKQLPLPSDKLAVRLIEMGKCADSTILWSLFYLYDTRHNLGFRESFLRG